MSGWCELEFDTQEDADAFEAAYCELLEQIDTYVRERELSVEDQKHTLRFWISFEHTILKTAFRLAGISYDDLGR